MKKVYNEESLQDVIIKKSIIPNSFKMEDLPAERVFVLTVTLSVCTETAGCEANHTIFSNLMLPKQPCQWDEGFVNSSM